VKHFHQHCTDKTPMIRKEREGKARFKSCAKKSGSKRTFRGGGTPLGKKRGGEGRRPTTPSAAESEKKGKGGEKSLSNHHLRGGCKKSPDREKGKKNATLSVFLICSHRKKKKRSLPPFF